MALSDVPGHLKISILYSDDDIVVIDKPCDLRSVPGHANPPPPEKGIRAPLDGDKKSSAQEQSGRKTAQEAWVKAIQMFSSTEVGDNHTDNFSSAVVKELLHNLGTTANPSCVPRKLETFVKYCRRNSKRLLSELELKLDSSKKDQHAQYEEEPVQKRQKCDNNSLLRDIAQTAYSLIQQKQRPLMNLPQPTHDWESAIGQLHLLGFGDFSYNVSASAKHLHVVHRLDCQTSGIMIVARNQTAAANLCQAWRERDSVKKIYLAHVRNWPPYHQQHLNEGGIEIPLGPSLTERIKWEVRSIEKGGKKCETVWKVHKDLGEDGITLELHPITGRTHQLRIHCATIGSGIVGDSLYGVERIKWIGDINTTHQKRDSKSTKCTDEPKNLRLHASKLSFVHPRTGESVLFESQKSW